jgi:hypothetical protein
MAIKNKTVDIVETFNFVHISLLVTAQSKWTLSFIGFHFKQIFSLEVEIEFKKFIFLSELRL